MAGPIPVFSFVFAAYAATSAGKSRDAEACVATNLAPGAPFRTAWRARTARGDAVFVKVRMVSGSKPLELRLAVGASGEAGEDLWLSGILESGLGFTGAPVYTGRHPKPVAAGKKIRFHVINVLEWRLGACPRASLAPTAPCPFPREPDFETLFCETANT